jgi:hypothetical protein
MKKTAQALADCDYIKKSALKGKLGDPFVNCHDIREKPRFGSVQGDS